MLSCLRKFGRPFRTAMYQPFFTEPWKLPRIYRRHISACPSMDFVHNNVRRLSPFLLTFIYDLCCFSLVLYMIYYPPHLKYATVDVDMHDDMPPHHIKTTAKSNNWKLSIILSWVVMIHLCVFTVPIMVLHSLN